MRYQVSNNTRLSDSTSFSNFIVSPANWKSPMASLKRSWYIKYRFYDLRYLEPKQVMVKSNLNKLHKRVERQCRVYELLAEIRRQLAEGYNPFEQAQPLKTLYSEQDDRERFLRQVPKDRITIEETDTLHDALFKACSGMDKRYTRTVYVAQVNNIGKILEFAAKRGYDKLPVNAFTGKMLRQLFNDIEKSYGRKWTDSLHNRYKEQVKRCYDVIVRDEASDILPYQALDRKRLNKKYTEVFTTEELKAVFRYTHAHDFNFYRFLMVFYLSGARPAEILRIRCKDVYIKENCFYVTVLKGMQKKTVAKNLHRETIQMISEMLTNVNSNWYLFSKDFVPGPDHPGRQPYRRRFNHVQKALEIHKNLYALKHYRMDEVEEYMLSNPGLQLALETSKALASHTNFVTGSRYAQNREKRMMRVLSTIPTILQPTLSSQVSSDPTEAS